TAADLDRLSDLTDLEREIDARGLLNLKLDILTRDRLEALRSHFQSIDSRWQRGEAVDAFLVGVGCTDGPRRLIGDADNSARHDAATRVPNLTRDFAERLRKQGRSGKHGKCQSSSRRFHHSSSRIAAWLPGGVPLKKNRDFHFEFSRTVQCTPHG